MWTHRAQLFGSILGLAACSGAESLPPAVRPRAPVPKASAAPGSHAPLDALPSDRIALVPEGTFGPYVGTRPEGTIAAWAAEISGKRAWMTVPIGDAGERLAEPKTVADAAPEVDLVAIKPLGEGDVKEFVLVSSSREFSGERVDAMVLGSRGELLGGPVPLAQSLTDVVWLDAVATPSGALVLWAVRRDDRAELYAVPLGPSGDARERPTPVLADARAWQVASVSGGAAIAAVTAGKARGESGPLRVAFVDGTAHVEKKSLVVADGGTAEPDVDLARLGERLVVAWSDRRDGEPRLYSALVSAAGTLDKPAAPLGRPFGPQALIRIVPNTGRGPVFVAWENLLERPDGGRAVRVALLSEDGTLGDASALVSMASPDGALPELATTERGLTALTLAPACQRGVSCERERAVPTFVALDKGLDVVASEPLRLAALEGGTAELAWGLSCRAEGCLTLASGGDSPTPVLAVRLDGISSNFEPAARRTSSDPPPRALAIAALGKSEPIAEVAAARVAAASLVAWVTDFDPRTPFSRSKVAAPDGKYEAPRAIVRVKSVPDQGAPGEAVAISYRAHSLGGVVLAPGEPREGEALLGWVGVDNKEPEVFVTLLGAGGKKVAQKMLTHVKGGVSDVAAAFLGDGWVVGWIEDHGGASEVHVLRLDRALKPAGAERRLGGTASTATSVQVLARDDHVLVVWSDARGPSAGVADIFAARLASKDLSPVGPEHLLAQTPGHSRSPAIAAFGEGAVVAWVEGAKEGANGGAGSIMMVRVDSGGEPVVASTVTVTLEGDPEGLGLTCGKASCRIAAATTVGEAGAIDAFEWRPDGDIRPRRLVALRGRPRDTVAPVVRGDDVFYSDETNVRDAWVRRMTVSWE